MPEFFDRAEVVGRHTIYVPPFLVRLVHQGFDRGQAVLLRGLHVVQHHQEYWRRFIQDGGREVVSVHIGEAEILHLGRHTWIQFHDACAVRYVLEIVIVPWVRTTGIVFRHFAGGLVPIAHVGLVHRWFGVAHLFADALVHSVRTVIAHGQVRVVDPGEDQSDGPDPCGTDPLRLGTLHEALDQQVPRETDHREPHRPHPREDPTPPRHQGQADRKQDHVIRLAIPFDAVAE